MNNEDKILELEAVLAQFLQPIKNIPFSVIIKSVSGHAILPFDLDSEADQTLLRSLVATAENAAALVRENPIQRNRPNEVGNDIEAFVMEAARKSGLAAQRPRTAAGRARTAGYPDILVYDAEGRPTYLECKIFGEGNAFTTMRSFYLSPSEDFKVTVDARHILLAFGVDREPISASRDSLFRAISYKIVDLSLLKCDVKYEFNSDNRRLYDEALILTAGTFKMPI